MGGVVLFVVSRLRCGCGVLGEPSAEGAGVSALAWLIPYSSRFQLIHRGWLFELILELDPLLVPLRYLLLVHVPQLLRDHGASEELGTCLLLRREIVWMDRGWLEGLRDDHGLAVDLVF